jgi:DNA-directed RNA polymerase specialized sigma54-like protein
MQFQLIQSQEMKQELSLVQIIEMSNLMSVPDEIMNIVAGAMIYNPGKVEEVLKKSNRGNVLEDNSIKVRTIYSSFGFPENDSSSRGRKGTIISPDVRELCSIFGKYNSEVNPDVTYIGRKNNKPEIVLSDHLKGNMGLSIYQIDQTRYPQASKLFGQLRKFYDWKRSILTESYLALGNEQREFFENFDWVRCSIFNQKDLADRLDISPGTISRLFSNRWVEARNLEDEKRYFLSKDLFVNKRELKKYIATSILNDLFREEFTKGEAYSDNELYEKSGKVLSRRTIAKYRKDSEIPAKFNRNSSYDVGEILVPFRIVRD